jgi:PAS domain S-box-containing protein
VCAAGAESSDVPQPTHAYPPVPLASAKDGLFREVVDALPMATAVLDRSGLVVAANRAFADLLQATARELEGEPLLLWLARASERESFGRAFMGLRDKEPGAGFVLEVGLVPKLGPRVDCVIRSCRLSQGHVSITCHPLHGHSISPETELGLAVTRSLDALDQGVLLVDEEGKVVHANPAGIALLGEGTVGRSLLELSSGDSLRTLGRALALARSGSWQGEVLLRRVDGEPLPVEISLAAGTGPAVVLLRDLRERRRREFEERLTGQVDRCLVATADPRHNVTAACAALAGGVGADRAIVLTSRAEVWQRWALEGDEPEPVIDLPAHLQPPKAWEAARDPERVEPIDPDVIALFGPLDGLEQVLRVVLRAPSGVVGHLALAKRDPEAWGPRDRALMATVASQIALGLASGLLTLETRELAAYQAMVLDQTSVLLDSVDAEGRIVTWNRASEQLLGISGEEAMGRRLGVEVGEAVDAHQWEDLWRTLVREGVVAREIVLRSSDAAPIPLHLEGRLLRDDDEVRGAVFVGLDLRDRRALEQQILRSQKLAAVGLLAAGIAHEINNPLSGVVGYSKLLLGRDLPDSIREKVEKIAHSGERCRKIVEGVLLFSRQQDGGVRRNVDLRDLLDRVLAIGEYQWRVHNVRIIREHDESVPVFADADQLEQVLLNLLSNAVDAMPRGGTIRLSLRREPDGGARLCVADEGHGIPEDIQARIFDPFFSTKEIGKGTGLGLAISYGIVQDHGGDIVVDSRPGQGARFTILLPPSGEAESPTPRDPETVAPERQKR